MIKLQSSRAAQVLKYVLKSAIWPVYALIVHKLHIGRPDDVKDVRKGVLYAGSYQRFLDLLPHN